MLMRFKHFIRTDSLEKEKYKLGCYFVSFNLKVDLQQFVHVSVLKTLSDRQMEKFCFEIDKDSVSFLR